MKTDDDKNPFRAIRETRSEVITFRMTPSEKAAVAALADARSLSVVDLIREAVAIHLDQQAAIRKKK